MVSKNQKKKQIVAPFQKSKDLVRCDLIDFTFRSPDLKFNDNSDYVIKMFRALSGAGCLNEQIKVVQTSKGLVRSQLLSPNHESVNLNEITFTVELLLQLYILPNFFPLRSSLEWVLETILQIKIMDKQQIALIVRDVCVSVWNKCVSSEVFTSINGNSNVGDMMSWTFTLNYMSLLEKEFHWLSAEDGKTFDHKLELVLSDDDVFFRYVAFVANAFISCANVVCPVVSESSLTVTASSSEVVRFAEVCGETMRAATTTLKANRLAVITPDNLRNRAWNQLVDAVFESSTRMLQSDLVGKDVVTSTAMGVTSLQWLWRQCTSDDSSSSHSTGYQLAAILGLLNLNETESSSPRLDLFAKNVGLHAILVTSFPTLPVISKCAVLKACLSVYDDTAMLLNCVATSVSADQKSHLEDVRSILISQGSEQGANEELEGLFPGAVFASIMRVANDNVSLNRLYGLQTLEAWLNRFEVMLRDGSLVVGDQNASSSSAVVVERKVLTRKLVVVAQMLTDAWSHPSRQLNHIVPAIYSRLVSFVSSALTGTSELSRSLWDPLVQQSLAMPAQHRGRYQTMNILLPFVGARLFLHLQPDLVRGLVEAVLERDIASSASSFIGSLLRAYQKEGLVTAVVSEPQSFDSMRPLWDTFVVSAVCSLNSRMRTNAADYLIPELLRLDVNAGPHLIRLIRSSVHRDGAQLNSKLWGLMNVCLQTRLMGLSGKDITFSKQQQGNAVEGDGLTEQEVVTACLSEDDELRLVSLTTLTVSLKTAAPMTEGELGILKYAMVYSLKSPESDHRHKVTRVVKTLLTRLKESSRVHDKELTRRERMVSNLRKDSERGDVLTDAAGVVIDYPARILECEQQIAISKAVVNNSFSVCLWLRDELLNNLYPGTSSDREVMSLDLVRCLFDTLGADAPQLQCFNTQDMVHTLLNLLVSSWDRSRKMAADLLLKFPRPLPGYLTADSVSSLLQWGCHLAGSPRLRESDAGALLIRDVYSIYCLDLGWEILVPSSVTIGSLSVGNKDADETFIFDFLKNNTARYIKCALFVHSMCDELAGRLDHLDTVFSTLNINEMCQLAETAEQIGDQTTSSSISASDSIPLCHGLILSLRFCLLESHAADLFNTINSPNMEVLQLSSGSTTNVWQPILRRVYRQALFALKVAMKIVAEAPSDVPFAPVPYSKNVTGENVESASTAPASAVSNDSSSMAASYINTNSIMGSGTGEEAVDEKGSAVQRAVVAAWLLVKEASSLLATLVDISPPLAVDQKEADEVSVRSDVAMEVEESSRPEEDPVDPTRKRACRRNTKLLEAAALVKTALPLLTIEDVSHAGSTILEALGRLKHMGAIAEAHSALQSISATVLKHGERSTQLCRLPASWLQSVLARLEGEQQVFILRRSAGFAYSFLSLLRAEPSNCKPTLLPVAMSSLLNTIEQGLDETVVDGDSSIQMEIDSSVDNESGRWKLSVHALNVVRLILCDASVGPDVDAFVAKCTELAVRGFSSSKWGVRNSSMMVFSAVVQRAVDNDKNDSGGASAATAVEFFQRFPSLFPFLLQELAKVTSFSVISRDEWPVDIAPHSDNVLAVLQGHNEVHPSLYPLLLLLSKLRAAMVGSAPAVVELVNGKEQTQTRFADISLFVPLVVSCSPQKVQQVRVMAAKALVALVPLRDVPSKAASILSSLVERLQMKAELRMSANDVHGSLLLVHELLQGLHRHVCVSSVSNKAFFSELQDELFSGCLPRLTEAVDLLASNRCAPLHLVLLRTARIARDLLQVSAEYSAATSDILLKESWIVLASVIPATENSTVSTPLLYEPVLWREALTDLVSHSLDGSSSGSKTDHRLSVAVILQLLDNPVSEVREGALLGCKKAIDTAGFSGVLSGGLSGCAVIEKLVRRAQLEKEPPILQLTLELLCSLTRQISCSSYSADTRSLLLLEGVDIFGVLVTKQWTSSECETELRLTTAACSATEVLGWLVAEHLSQCKSGASLNRPVEVVARWLAVLEAAASEDQISSMRESAAASILTSGALPFLNGYILDSQSINNAVLNSELVSLCMRVWNVVLTLLQDDDFDVREVANRICSGASDSFKSVSKGVAHTSSVRRYAEEVELPVGFICNESYTLEHISENLAALLSAVTLRCGGEVAIAQYELLVTRLVRTVGDEQTIRSLLSASGDSVSQKIFEAEQANLYIESVKAGNVFVVAVCDSLRLLPPSEASNAVLLHVSTSAAALAFSAFGILRCARNALEWTMGGATQQRDVFQFVFLSLKFLAETLNAMRPHLVRKDIVLPLSVKESLQRCFGQLQLWTEEQNSSSNKMHVWIEDCVEKLRLFGEELQL